MAVPSHAFRSDVLTSRIGQLKFAECCVQLVPNILGQLQLGHARLRMSRMARHPDMTLLVPVVGPDGQPHQPRVLKKTRKAKLEGTSPAIKLGHEESQTNKL